MFEVKYPEIAPKDTALNIRHIFRILNSKKAIRDIPHDMLDRLKNELLIPRDHPFPIMHGVHKLVCYVTSFVPPCHNSDEFYLRVMRRFPDIFTGLFAQKWQCMPWGLVKFVMNEKSVVPETKIFMIQGIFRAEGELETKVRALQYCFDVEPSFKELLYVRDSPLVSILLKYPRIFELLPDIPRGLFPFIVTGHTPYMSAHYRSYFDCSGVVEESSRCLYRASRVYPPTETIEEDTFLFMKMLIELGANPNGTGNITDTNRPLWNVVFCSSRYTYRVKMVKLLLEAGATPWLRDGKGTSLADCVYQGYYWRYPTEPWSNSPYRMTIGKQGSKPRKIWDEILAVLDTACSQWHPSQHLRYSPEFRERVKAFLLVNARLRKERRPWLPRDPRLIVIRYLGEGEYLDKNREVERGIIRDVLLRHFGVPWYDRRLVAYALSRGMGVEELKGLSKVEIIDALIDNYDLKEEELDSVISHCAVWRSNYMKAYTRARLTKVVDDYVCSRLDENTREITTELLKEVLKARGLATSGSKRDLISRLKADKARERAIEPSLKRRRKSP